MHSAQCSETKNCPFGRGKKCPKPSGQSFTPSPLNGQCLYAHTTFQKGASLRTVRSLYFLCSPSTAQNAFFFLRTTKESFLPDISQKCENLKKEYSFFLNSCESISLTYRFSLVDKQHQPVFIFNLRSKYKFNSANLRGTDQLTH